MNQKQVIYANVHGSSKYSGQRQEKPFPVSLQADVCGYVWKGGIGGQYRTADLEFFLLKGGEFVMVPMLASAEQMLLERVCEVALREGAHSSWYELIDGILKHNSDLAFQRYREAKTKEDRVDDSEVWV